jgi:hypothetical protein
MKTIILSCVMAVLTVAVQAQTMHISTSSKQTCYWNESTQKFDKCGDDAEYVSLFTINPDETVFTHTTNDIKSSYFVSKKTYNSEYDEFEYDVTSDVGNKYTFFVDLKNNLVKIMSSGHDNGADDYLISFTVKKSWKDSD